MRSLLVGAKVSTVATLAWGALAFGAVYPWAYWPLAAMAACTGIACAFSGGRSDLRLWPVVILTLVFAAAVAVQLLPLRMETIRAVSPQTVPTLQRLDLRVAVGLATSHPLSIAPDSTVAGFTLFLAAAVFAIGLAALCSRVGVRWLGTSVTVLGVMLALIGMIQKATFNGKVYGFWQPIEGGNPFGPFVNRNHFAGWMMMALPVALGMLCSRIDKGMIGAKPGFREKVIWLGSQAASELVLFGTAAALMGLSLVLTFSKSGVVSFGLAVAITGIFVVFGVGGRARRAAGLMYLSVLLVLVISWVGIDQIATQFEHANWSEFGDRRGAWADARSIAAIFPMSGVGFGGYGMATTLYQAHDLVQHYAQAHNDYLQLAAEGGVLLTAPALLLVAAIAVRVVGRFRDGGSATSWWVRAGAVTGILAIALQELVDFSIQMPGNAMLLAVLIGIALHRAPVAVDRRAKAA